MKKLIAVMAFAGVLSVPSVIFAADEDGASWYGSLRGGVEFGGGEDARFKDGGSRWGIKGSSELSEGLSAVYNFEHKISTGDASQPGGRLAYAGLSGGFGSLTLGQIWNAAFNHVGAITDNSRHYGDAHMGYRHGNALSYAMSAGAVSLQLDAIMDGAKETGDAVDKLEFGMSVDLGDIGKVGLAYVDTKDVHTMTDPVVVIPEAILRGEAPSYTLGGSAPTYSLTRGKPGSMDAVASTDDGEEFNLEINDDNEVVVSSDTKWYDADENEVDATVTWKAADANQEVTTRILYVDKDADHGTSGLAGLTFDSKGRQTNGGDANCATTPADCEAIAVFAIDNTPAERVIRLNGVIVGYSGDGQTFQYVAPGDDDLSDSVVVSAKYETPGEITGVAQDANTGYTTITQNANTGYTSGSGMYTGTYRADETGMYVMTHEMDEDGDYVAKYVDDMTATHVMKDGEYEAAAAGETATHYEVMDAEGETAYTKTMYSRTYMSKPVEDVVKGSRDTHIAAQFNLGPVTAHLGYSQLKENGASAKTKVTHYGFSGSLGDTGMGFLVQARNVDGADGTDSDPWMLGLTKSLGGGATAYFEHGSEDDQGTTVGLQVNF